MVTVINRADGSLPIEKTNRSAGHARCCQVGCRRFRCAILDNVESHLLEELIRSHPDRLRIYRAGPEMERKLDLLCQQRRKAIEMAVDLENQLRATLTSKRVSEKQPLPSPCRPTWKKAKHLFDRCLAVRAAGLGRCQEKRCKQYPQQRRQSGHSRVFQER